MTHLALASKDLYHQAFSIIFLKIKHNPYHKLIDNLSINCPHKLPNNNELTARRQKEISKANTKCIQVVLARKR